MATKPLPDQAMLLKLLRYDPDTGKLVWRERSPDMFSDDGTHTAEVRCGGWNKRFSGKPAFASDTGHGYLEGFICNDKFLAHRIIWKLVTGHDPEFIDHINGVRSDNRFCNLRTVSIRENSMNTKIRARNRSGCHGVTWRPESSNWRAMIKVGAKFMHLGHYDDVEEAIRVRRAAERKYGYHPNHGRVITPETAPD